MIENLTDIERLRELALDQQGLVTSRQALEAGVSAGSLRQLSHRGRIERMAQGVYRIPQAPYNDLTYLRLALFWTGRDDAVLAYETALDCYGVCDIFPRKIHVTVRPKDRIRRSGGTGYIVHHQSLLPDDISWWEGMPVTTLPRTLLDCAAWGTPAYLLRQAVANSWDRGLIKQDLAQEVISLIDGREHG